MAALTERSTASGQLPPGHRLGRYEVLARLASGGMAVVYVANAQGAAGFERLVAIKVLHANLAYEEEFIRMFLDEARLAARIRHPNVVATMDISDTPDAGYFLVMEYVEGDHLGALLSSAHKREERIDIPVVLRIVIDALGGLGAAHDLRDDDGKRLNLVHRDVSPHNVLVGSDGTSRLTDFGVAKAEDRLTHTRDGQVKGKLAYMAPEQASQGTCDARSDLFAMGIILWECVTGRRLFRAESTAATLHKLLHDEIAPPSAVDPSLAPLDPLLRRALARDPATRFQSADEMIEAIEEVASAVGGVASRRAVAKAVERYANEKLERDRRVVEGARVALRSGQPYAELSGEAASGAEGTNPSRSAARARSGLTPPAGTVPRLFTTTRTPNPVTGGHRRNTMRGMPAPPELTSLPIPPPPAGAAPLPPVPPPVGTSFSPPNVAASRALRPVPAAEPASQRSTLLVVVLLTAIAVLAGGWLALRLTRPEGSPVVTPLPATATEPAAVVPAASVTKPTVAVSAPAAAPILVPAQPVTSAPESQLTASPVPRGASAKGDRAPRAAPSAPRATRKSAAPAKASPSAPPSKPAPSRATPARRLDDALMPNPYMR